MKPTDIEILEVIYHNQQKKGAAKLSAILDDFDHVHQQKVMKRLDVLSDAGILKAERRGGVWVYEITGDVDPKGDSETTKWILNTFRNSNAG